MTNHDKAERDDLIAQLADVRSALTRSVQGLTDEQAAERPTISALCPGGVIKHVTAMEEGWLRFAADGTTTSYDLPEGVTWADIMAGTAREVPQWMIDHQNGFQVRPGETVAGILERYEEVAARTEETITAIPDLSATYPLPPAPWGDPGGEWSARRAILHVIHETAQHAGHADIIRETLDGKTAT